MTRLMLSGLDVEMLKRRLCRRGWHCAVLMATVLLCLPIVVEAQSTPDCERFASTPYGTVDLFAGNMPTFEDGQVLPSPGAFALALKPSMRVVYPYKSVHDHNVGNGAVIAIEFVAPARYRIGLSHFAQVDVIQDNVHLGVLPRDVSCPGISQTLDIVAAGGPLTIQISGAKTSQIKIVVVREAAARRD